MTNNSNQRHLTDIELTTMNLKNNINECDVIIIKKTSKNMTAILTISQPITKYHKNIKINVTNHTILK